MHTPVTKSNPSIRLRFPARLACTNLRLHGRTNIRLSTADRRTLDTAVANRNIPPRHGQPTIGMARGWPRRVSASARGSGYGVHMALSRIAWGGSSSPALCSQLKEIVGLFVYPQGHSIFLGREKAKSQPFSPGRKDAIQGFRDDIHARPNAYLGQGPQHHHCCPQTRAPSVRFDPLGHYEIWRRTGAACTA